MYAQCPDIFLPGIKSFEIFSHTFPRFNMTKKFSEKSPFFEQNDKVFCPQKTENERMTQFIDDESHHPK